LPERAELAARLKAALADLPLRAEKLHGFLDDVATAKSQPPLDAESFKGSTLGLAVDSMLQERASRWTVLMPVRGVAGRVEPRRSAPRWPTCPALFLDLGLESTRLYADYLDEVIWYSLAGFAAIALLLLVTLRSLRRTLRVLAPLVLAVLLVMATLALLGERLTLLHLVGLLLTVAVGSNYALFFAARAVATPHPGLAAGRQHTTVIGRRAGHGDGAVLRDQRDRRPRRGAGAGSVGRAGRAAASARASPSMPAPRAGAGARAVAAGASHLRCQPGVLIAADCGRVARCSGPTSPACQPPLPRAAKLP
jgi:hypothetical protein